VSLEPENAFVRKQKQEGYQEGGTPTMSWKTGSLRKKRGETQQSGNREKRKKNRGGNEKASPVRGGGDPEDEREKSNLTNLCERGKKKAHQDTTADGKTGNRRSQVGTERRAVWSDVGHRSKRSSTSWGKVPQIR